MYKMVRSLCLCPRKIRTYYVGNPQIFDIWVDKKLSKGQKLHSQTIQAVRKKYTQSWDSFYTHQKNGNKDARPPEGLKNYFTPRWLQSAIRFQKEGSTGKRLRLSMGKDREFLYIDLHKSFNWDLTDSIVQIELVYNYGQWVLHCTYKSESSKYPKVKNHEKIFGVDLGEIHPFVASDESETHIFMDGISVRYTDLEIKGSQLIRSLLADVRNIQSVTRS